MKAVVTWQQVTRTEVELTDEDLDDMVAKGIDLEDGPAIARYIREQDWLADYLVDDNWFERDAPDVIDIEPQDDDGTLL